MQSYADHRSLERNHHSAVENFYMISFSDLSLRNKFFFITILFATIALLFYGFASLATSYSTSMKDAEQGLAMASGVMSEGIITTILFEQKVELYWVAEMLTRSNAKNIDWFLDREIPRLQQYDSIALLDKQGNKIWSDNFLKEVKLDVGDFSKIDVQNIVDAYGRYDGSYYILQVVPFKNWDDNYFLIGGLSESRGNVLSQIAQEFRFKDTGFSAVVADSNSSTQVLYASPQMPKDSKVLTAVGRAKFERMVPLNEGSHQYYIYKKKIPRTPLYMTFFISKFEVLSGIYRTIASQALVFVIIVFLIWFFVGSTVSRVAEPIESLTSIMSKVADGNYEVEVPVVERKDEIGVLSKVFAHLVASIRDYSEKLRQLSIQDALTGLYNKREFESRFNKEWERSVRYNVPLSFFMLDIDNFKHFNDDFGHQVGDEVLKSVAKVLQENIRASDTAFRYGGEEFCVMLPETNLGKAKIVGEKLRTKVGALPAILAEGRETRKITISIGVASFPECTLEKGQLVSLSDSALYQAKKGGRNRVEIAEKSKDYVVKEALS